MGIVARKLSGSTKGGLIGLTATTSTGATTIHTCLSTSTGVAGSWDEVYLWAVNSSTGTINCTIEVVDTTAAHTFSHSISSRAGQILVLPGIRLNGAATLKGWKGTATLTPLSVFGFVNKISS